MKESNRSLLLNILFLTGMTNPIFAEDINYYAKGLHSEIEGNLPHAIEQFKQSVEKRNLKEAKFGLGRIYKDQHDDEQSFKWFKEAADQGSIFAQYELGKLFLTGNSFINKNLDEAKKWLMLAAKKGKLAEAAYDLSTVVKSTDDSSNWLTKAAELGSRKAMKKLAETGQNTKDLKGKKQTTNYWQEKLSASQE